MTDGKSCPSSDEIAAYAEGRDEDSEIARHVRECAQCAEVVRIIADLDDLDALAEIGEYLNEIDALAGELTAEPAHRWTLLIREPRFLRVDLAQRLLRLGIDARWKDARRAIDLTRAAARITDILQSEANELLELRFETWKIHSALLRESGRYEECRAALVRASEAANHVTDVETAQAAILLSRALVAIERDIWNPEEAAALLDIVEPIYHRRDSERWRDARTVRGSLLYRAGDARCVDVYREVFEVTPKDDRHAWYDALSNLVMARVEFGDVGADIDDQLSAIELEDRRRETTACIARDQWLRGKILAARDTHTEALDTLEKAVGQYEALHNYDAAVRVGIDRVASLIALEEYDAAIDACRRLADRSALLDRQEPSRRRTLTAQVTAYLRELAQRYALTVDVVIDIRRYVNIITNRLPIPFIPPLPLSTV